MDFLGFFIHLPAMKFKAFLFALVCLAGIQPLLAQPLAPSTDSMPAAVTPVDTAAPVPERPRPDSVIAPESVRILIEKLSPAEIRSRLIPRVMSRGWTMVRNRNDSIFFERPAVPELVTPLFGEVAVASGHRVRLSFVIQATTNRIGSFLEVWAQVYPRNGKALAYPTTGDALAVSLEELRRDLENPVNAEIQ
jgi:hypothetical protein